MSRALADVRRYVVPLTAGLGQDIIPNYHRGEGKSTSRKRLDSLVCGKAALWGIGLWCLWDGDCLRVAWLRFIGLEMAEASGIDTLIIIGNGFDLWQGLPTSYSEFEKYYRLNRDRIMRRLHIKPIEVVGDDGDSFFISPVEVLYGDPFDLSDLDYEFWSSYEDSLDEIDDQRINFIFGKDRKGLKRIQKLAGEAKRILQAVFSDWVCSIRISKEDSVYRFPENCFIINFNYTDTVIQRFGVEERNISYIHGSAHDKESIIVGHSTHPETALPALKDIGGRFEGLFYIEQALFESDKHVDDNFNCMASDIALQTGAMIEDIKAVYVLGHSFGNADFGYFSHLTHIMNGKDEDPFEEFDDWVVELLLECDEEDFVCLNINYAISHEERLDEYVPFGGFDSSLEISSQLPRAKQRELEKAAVRARYLMEQFYRDAEYQLMFMDIVSKQSKSRGLNRSEKKKALEKAVIGWEDYKEELRDIITDRKQATEETGSSASAVGATAKWHITCHTDESRKRVNEVMKRLGYDNYEIYSSIDDCIECFKVE